MRDDHSVPAEGEEFREKFLDRPLSDHHGVVDGGELRDPKGDRNFGIHEDIHPIADLSLSELHRADLYDFIRLRMEARGLNIEDDGLRKELLPSVPLHYGLKIVDQIALQAVNQLKIPFLPELFQMGGRIRKGLHDAVIRDRHRIHAKGKRRIDVIIHIGYAVHIGHLRVEMELYPLLLRAVRPLLFLKLVLFDAA